MEAGRLQTKTLIVCLGTVIIAEAAARVGSGLFHPMILSGLVRLVETTLMVTTVLLLEKGLAPIGLTGEGILRGLRAGCIWSAGFGVITLIGFSLMAWAGMNPLALIYTPLPTGPFDRILFFLVAGLVGPVAEEVFFRGLLYGFFRQWGAPAAVLLSTLLFILAHPAPSGVPITRIVGGLVFALAYEVEKDLLAPIIIHASANTAIFTLSLIQG
ncbi:MAG: CPBP family intramembrane metalloprotease [Deltaproteobacteria bacterium]|nr:CPBP family intramembrane metalloprotease [Deltaproteobacteria bacterium]MBW2354036.1 CPBP family intramembrane metalloprotease [Deltaproteobacteria bacterium]